MKYGKEPWLIPLLKNLAKNNEYILEVGCGQGTDALTMCRMMEKGGRYVGVDYSDNSVKEAVSTAGGETNLNVNPEFKVGNAEQLDIESDSVDYVYSMGVLHHTADEQAAISEIFRVLKPNGKACVILYRKGAPKVLIAKILRGIQSVFDMILRTDRVIYKWMLGHHMEDKYGTMLVECFGVPYMKWYSRGGMHALFSAFQINELKPMGYNIPFVKPRGNGRSSFGYLWVIEVEKRGSLIHTGRYLTAAQGDSQIWSKPRA